MDKYIIDLMNTRAKELTFALDIADDIHLAKHAKDEYDKIQELLSQDTILKKHDITVILFYQNDTLHTQHLYDNAQSEVNIKTFLPDGAELIMVIR